MINRRSIRFQLLFWYAAVMVLVFSSFFGFMYFAQEHYLVQNLKGNLTRRGHQISETLLHEEATNSAWLSNRIRSLYAPETSGRFLRITLQQTNQLYRSGSPPDKSFDASRVPFQRGLTEEWFREIRTEDGIHLLMVGIPITISTNEFFLEIGASRAPLKELLRQTSSAMLLAAPLSICVALLGGYLLLGRALKPVTEITSTAEKINLHSLNESLPPANSGDEIERLTLALNRMISRLNLSFDYTRRFIADASHELRTPLTIIRGEVESVVERLETPPAVREKLGSCLEEVERLTKINEF